jgi:glutamyl-Q tRNA(Asp) synthetase
MATPVFRFAPSPNGRLHLGHAYSALLNEKMARGMGGRLLLRIEDTDVTRSRREFVDGIFEDLRWLGLEWEEPVRIQSQHFADYERVLQRLWKMEAIYPCFCSRSLAKTLATPDPDGQPHYAGTCRTIRREEAEARMAVGEPFGWRLKTEGDASMWGDAMISKRGTGSSYHIAVVTDDALQGVTHVVRGRDIEPATPMHMLLQRLLGFPVPHYHHHDLIRDEAGEKLAKSKKSVSLVELRAQGMTAEEVRERLGFLPILHGPA